MDKLFELIGQAGFPSTIVGGIVFLFFYLRKQEEGIRVEQTSTLKRLQEDKVAMQETIDKLEQEADDRETMIDTLRKKLRDVEDESSANRRRADGLEAKLEEQSKPE